MEPLEDEIRRLKASIKLREGVREGFLADPQSYVELTKEITELYKRLNLLTVQQQQGKFASPISVVLSHSYR